MRLAGQALLERMERIPLLGGMAREGMLGSWFKAAFAFGVRVASAGMLLVTQILLARWMGSHEFGIYVFTWTLVVLIGDLIPLGFALSAQRIIPAARHAGDVALLRGFVFSSRLFVLCAATATMLVMIGAVHALEPWLENVDPVAVSIAALALPAYAVVNVMDGISRAFDRIYLGLVPPLIGRPLMLIALVGGAHAIGLTSNAVSAVSAAVIATWALALVQFLLLRRCLLAEAGPGQRATDFRQWLSVSLQIFASMCFVSLFTYTDILVLNALSTPQDVAIYFAAIKTMSITSFISFAIASVVAHKFVERHVAGDRAGLERLVAGSVRWNFWASAALVAGILALGHFILGLFGPDFTVGYGLLFVLAIGFLIRASVGPAERLLNMLGEQRIVIAVYAAAFAVNLTLALSLVPWLGLYGAAIAVSAGSLTEAAALYAAVRMRLGLHAFVLGYGLPSAPKEGMRA